MQVGRRLDVDGDILHAAEIAIESVLRLFDHEMDVERQVRRAAQRFDHGRSEREGGDEPAVHDVHVDHVGPALARGRERIREPGEVGRQDRRSDPHGVHGCAARAAVKVTGSFGEQGYPDGGYCFRMVSGGSPS